jgi:hypothetical protein
LIWGAAILFLCGSATLLWSGKGRALVHKLNGGRLTTAGAGEDDELRVRLARARAAIRDGRFDLAFELYRSLDQRRLQAEDFCALGSVLLKEDRIVSGWAALEAARRIDPTHGPTLQAWDAIQTKLALAAKAERAPLHEAAERVEFLLSVPGGTQLGILVLGLVRYAKDPDHEDEFLDRLMVRDRAVLRGVDTSAAAIRLVARLLLETGRPVDARDLLQDLVATPVAGLDSSAKSGSGPAADREAAWLLSRAALQLDHRETADAMLALAGDFGAGATASPEPAPYVGSKRCGDCHRTIYQQQQGPSRHALTLRFGSGLKNAPLPKEPVPDPVVPRISHSFSRKGDDRIELETRVDDRVIRAIVEYAVGSGRHGITMVAKDEEGIDRELRISYFPAGQTWGETKGVDGAPGDAGGHIGVGLSRGALHRCLHCHTTWFRSVDASGSGPRGPEARDHGIGCERCHGPGLNHVMAVESGFAELAIAQTSATPPNTRLRSCTECHAADGSVPPSDPEFTRAQGTTLLFSRCFTASKGLIGCTTCHDPHRVLETSIAHYEAKCLSCHGATTSRHDAGSSPAVVREESRPIPRNCPVNPTSQCISCHMPQVEDRSRRSRFTDHHIRVHRDQGLSHALEGTR